MVIQSVDGEHHEKAVELLKAAQGSVKLVVRYTPKVLEEMEARFEKMRSARRRQQHTSYSWDCSLFSFNNVVYCMQYMDHMKTDQPQYSIQIINMVSK